MMTHVSGPITVLDPLYGRVKLPKYLSEFLVSPEFQRLGGVRLLNSDSIELAALSEVRRRSHTLGVLHLGTRLTLLEFGPDDVKALLFAIVLHDIGTPPFGHSVEYEYIRRFGINHEDAAVNLLNGEHHTLSYEHQVYAGRTVKLYSLLEKTGCADVVRSILRGQHPLSSLIFGDIDLDNLDNVYRMAWYLGERCDLQVPIRLASLIQVNSQGRKILGEEHRCLIEDWARLRSICYKVLFNSALHRQRQAILSRIIFESMENHNGGPPLIDKDDWFLTDEDILFRLRRSDRLKMFFSDFDREVRLPEIQYEFEFNSRLDRPSLMRHRDAICSRLAYEGANGYVMLIPFGEAIERCVRFEDYGTGRSWTVGSPRLIYRVHVYLSPHTTKKAKVAGLEAKVQRILREYFDDNGWSKYSRS